jgi:hypothetical protein
VDLRPCSFGIQDIDSKALLYQIPVGILVVIPGKFAEIASPFRNI